MMFFIAYSYISIYRVHIFFYFFKLKPSTILILYYRLPSSTSL
nr:MAG TPA: hypothetical protein [Caudoviricetes sp.]